jgi:hypothetical protein
LKFYLCFFLQLGWKNALSSFKFPFAKQAIALCLKERKLGDWRINKKRFVALRSNYLGIKRVDLYFRVDYIQVWVVAPNRNKTKALLKETYKKELDIMGMKSWKEGFNFKISTTKQFNILVTFLNMGTQV